MDSQLFNYEVVAGSGTSWTLAEPPISKSALLLFINTGDEFGYVLISPSLYALNGAIITTTDSYEPAILLAGYTSSRSTRCAVHISPDQFRLELPEFADDQKCPVTVIQAYPNLVNHLLVPVRWDCLLN